MAIYLGDVSPKKCTSRIVTDVITKILVKEKNTHHDDRDGRLLEQHIRRTNAKRKTMDDVSARPSKIIHSELQKLSEETFFSKDMKSVAKAVYRQIYSGNTQDVSRSKN